MSAPNTNIDKQRRRHWGPLIGMAVVVIFGIAMIMMWLGDEAAQSDPASPPPAQNIETVAPPATPQTPTDTPPATGAVTPTP